MYKTLNKIYYSDAENYENLFKLRYTNECAVHLKFPKLNDTVFYLNTPELTDNIYKIMKLNCDINNIYNNLPKIAIHQFRIKCLIDEIIQTNNIEGIHSSRKDIKDVLEKDNSENKRFYGIVNKYLKLSENIKLDSNASIRELFNDLVSDEIKIDNPVNLLDGDIFRKDSVSIYTATQKKIHDGLTPESNIIEAMTDALEILHDENLIPLIRISIFHYLFGFIHPFYDGNGRVGRFISSYFFSKELNPLIGYRLSYTIKENIKQYYDSFDICNNRLNKGELTYFLHSFIDILKKSMEALHTALSERNDKLIYYGNLIDKNDVFSKKREKGVLFLLVQAELFSDSGITMTEMHDAMKTTKVTVNKILNHIDSFGLLKKQKSGRTYYYGIDLEKFDIKEISNE